MSRTIFLFTKNHIWFFTFVKYIRPTEMNLLSILKCSRFFWEKSLNELRFFKNIHSLQYFYKNEIDIIKSTGFLIMCLLLQRSYFTLIFEFKWKSCEHSAFPSSYDADIVCNSNQFVQFYKLPSVFSICTEWYFYQFHKTVEYHFYFHHWNHIFRIHINIRRTKTQTENKIGQSNASCEFHDVNKQLLLDGSLDNFLNL